MTPYRSKVCKDCKLEKPLTEFYVHKKMADGRLNSCKKCRKEYGRQQRTKGLTRLIDRRKYLKLKKERPQLWKARQIRNKETSRESRRKAQHRQLEKHPERSRIYSRVQRAIKSGDLIRKPCEVCTNPDSHAHHDDYRKPLVVVWLCAQHHKDRHREETI